MSKTESPASLICRAVCLILMVIMGILLLKTIYVSSSAYKNSSEDVETTYTARILLDYVTAAVRAGNRQDCVYVSDFEGIPCLFTKETIDGEEYLTAVYCHEGTLKSLFFQADSGLTPEDGTEIISCDSFVPVQESETLISFSFKVGDAESFGYANTVRGTLS